MIENYQINTQYKNADVNSCVNQPQVTSEKLTT